MERSESIKEIADALRKFQKAQSPIPANQTNKFLNNKYADLHALIEHTKENRHANNLSISQLLDGDGVTTILMHTSGEWISSTFKIEPTESKGTNNAQQMGVAITYTRRYAYAAILGLISDEDTDGATKPKTPSKAPERAQDVPPQDPLKITEPQRKRLFAIAKEYKVDDETVKDIVVDYGYESSKDILKKDYEAIIDAIKGVGIEPED